MNCEEEDLDNESLPNVGRIQPKAYLNIMNLE